MACMTDNPYYMKHADTLARALTAISERDYWSAFPESPSPRVYGETAAADGKAAFEAYLRQPFPLDQPGDRVATEASPFGIELGIGYPHTSVDTLIAAATAALPAWRDAGPQVRAGVCLEILSRLHAHVFELTNAVHATSGQAFVMAFQAGGPHALDRGLEAVAYAYAEQTRHPGAAEWTKPAAKPTAEPLRINKTFHVVPRGVALVIGCNTFPTWNSYPGLFASLATGNPVIAKPHPGAVLPMAITVRYAREVLAEAGFDPNLMQLAAEAPGERIAATLATRPEVKIVDFTGSTEFGEWLEDNARQAAVYTEKAGVNTIVVDSTDDFAGMCRNIGFSLSLYSGQMCTTPQNILVPEGGIETDQGHKSYQEVAVGIAGVVRKLTAADPARGVELTGAIANDANLHRIDEARSTGEILLDSTPVEHPSYPQATVRTPLLLRQTEAGEDVFGREWFGPISYVIATGSTGQSLALFRRIVGARGALTAAVYSTDDTVLDAAEEAALAVGVHLSCNLTGGVFVNQSAAFSDFHGTGANAAANAALTDGAYVANRFRIVQTNRA
jgi:phenylacetic acid degradation protein paaN